MLSLVDLLTVSDCFAAAAADPPLVAVVVVIVLIVLLLLLLLFWTSWRVVPDKYDINAGSIGRIQGEKKEPAPANAETTTFISTTNNLCNFCINTYVHIMSVLHPNYFLTCYIERHA